MFEGYKPASAEDNFFEVKNRDQWICWRSEQGKKGQKSKKPPAHPTSGCKINYLDPSNWMSYEEAVMYSDAFPFLDGIGVVLTEDDEYCGIDIDERVDGETGEMPPWIPNLLEEVPSS